MQAKRASITGVTGQNESYMAGQLLEKAYEVHALVRRSSSFNRGRIDHLHYADVTDSSRVHQLVTELKPHNIYNLAAQSHARVSFDEPLTQDSQPEFQL